ncbi:MAG: acyl carrier protein [Actinomycetota bacterium]|nr:acyl carrier protein [Actinomycetota bacterium]MED5232471.1 acyl carrier protein [Actinomycetota bacterium]MED5394347.1 acyl carrier protein [Actinomycetota bacterium]MEE3352739.1 acyl carrier protein [Actinomycetota bacterium]
MSDDNFEKFRKCAVDVLSVEPDQVTMEASFADDLDADSLDLVELVMALEEEFGVSVEEEELEDITTIGGAYELITGKL